MGWLAWISRGFRGSGVVGMKQPVAPVENFARIRLPAIVDAGGWLSGWLAVCLAGWLAGWLAGCCLARWRVGQGRGRRGEGMRVSMWRIIDSMSQKSNNEFSTILAR